jgi:hypothetical protein
MSDIQSLLNLSWVLLCAGQSRGIGIVMLCRNRVPEVLSQLEASYPSVCAALEEEAGKGH